MAVLKQKDITSLLGQPSASVPLSPDSPANTDIRKLRETTRSKLAMTIVICIFSALGLISFLLFVLVILNKPEATLFKDVLLTLFGFAQGISALFCYLTIISGYDNMILYSIRV